MRKLLKILLWIVLFLIVAIVAIYLTAGFWIRSAVSTLVPQITQTQASLDDADISIFEGKVALKGFKIANPAGFANPNAFEFKEILVHFEPSSLLQDKIIINEIKVDGTKVDAELAKNGNINLMVLNNNVQGYLGNPVPQQAGVEKTQNVTKANDSSNKTVVIKDLQIVNSSLKLALFSNTREVKLPAIHEKNIGEKKKTTLGKALADIFSELLTTSFTQISASGKDALNSMLNDLTQRTKDATPFRDIAKQLF